MKKERREKTNSFWLIFSLLVIQTILFLFFRLPFYLPFLIFLIFFSGFYFLVLKGLKGWILTLVVVLWIFLSLALFFGLFYLNKQAFLSQKFLFAFLFFLCYFSTAAFLAWLYDFSYK